MTCSVCHAESEGRFCSNCGATLVSATCPSCKADAPAGARFCPHCGYSLGATRKSGAAVAWIAGGATVAAVAAVLIVRLTSPSTFGGAPVASAPGELSASAPAPDISSMSPKERATRLYNRIMTAAESGDTAQMHFFVPMAVQSYALLGDLDADAHYHVGMIHLVNGEYAAASSQADSIARANPTNLLGAALKAELAKRRGDAPARKRAYRDLMANYDREMASGKGEYTDHREMLERMHTDAQKEGAK